MNVLFFSAWYPYRYDAMAGLFVRKHAKAVSRHARVCVLFPFSDAKLRDFDVVEEHSGAVTEIYVYYPFCKNPLLKTISKGINYVRAFLKGYKVVLAHFGKPDICHVNVLTRSGLLAYFLKKRYQIPYVITEHWSRYLPQNFSYTGFFQKKMTELVVRNAACIMPVSGVLENSMKSLGLRHPNYDRINNVVDDFFYLPQETKMHQQKRILHISCFDDKAKNISGILRAVKELSKKRTDFELVIVGTGVDFKMTIEYAQSLNLPEGVVQFIGEQTPQEVCNWFYQSDFFLLFSNYETAGVVISESLASGKPIISTPVGIVPDVITSENGRMVAIGDEHQLAEETDWMLDHFHEFDAVKIREAGRQFNYDAVSDKLMDIYNKTLQPTLVV